MIQRILKVRGLVETVGYREVVVDLASHYGIVGNVRSLRGATVQIICQGGRENVIAFTKAANITEGFVEVWEVEVVEEIGIDELSFERFEIERGSLIEEFNEYAVHGLRYLRAINEAARRILEPGEGKTRDSLSDDSD